MTVAVGSCIQIALFVVPALVLIAWGLNKPLTLLFDPIETMVRVHRLFARNFCLTRVVLCHQCLFLSVLLVKFSVGDGKAHWMSGVALIGRFFYLFLGLWLCTDS